MKQLNITHPTLPKSNISKLNLKIWDALTMARNHKANIYNTRKRIERTLEESLYEKH